MTAALALRDSYPPLLQWARTFEETAAVCVVLARTPFVPASLRVMVGGDLDEQATAAQVTAAILCGQELGLPPIAALRSIVVINGTPALNAMVMRALVQQRGHRIWVHESTATRAIVRGYRVGDEAHVQQSVWTMDRARALGIAGKPNYRTQPQSMLLARATAECCRLVASDVLLGVPYSSEELADTPAQDMPKVDRGLASEPSEPSEPSTPPRRRTARRAPQSVETVDLPPSVGDETAAVSPETRSAPRVAADGGLPSAESTGDFPMITDGQSKRMHASFNDLKIIDRDDRLAMTRKIIGREIDSSIELTEVEASRVLDELSLLLAQRADDKWVPPDDEPFDE